MLQQYVFELRICKPCTSACSQKDMTSNDYLHHIGWNERFTTIQHSI